MAESTEKQTSHREATKRAKKINDLTQQIQPHLEKLQMQNLILENLSVLRAFAG